MSDKYLLSACIAALSSPLVFAEGPFDQFKGKMKEGQYETKMDMDMSGMKGAPPGMGKQSHSFTHCVTAKDIEKGQVGRGRPDGKAPEDCEVKNFKMSGNTASYTMECKGRMQMTADNTVTFSDSGYRMDMKMAMNQGGQVMNMTQRMESKYLGPCPSK